MSYTNPLSNRLSRPVLVPLMFLLAIGFTPQASADESNKETIVTINQPVEIPGKVLPPGTYVFKLLDSPSNRNILQIFDKDQKHLYATIMAVPDYRLNPPDKPLVRFEERPSNSPEAIKALFYPGDNYGLEFVYPHNRATELAKRTKQNVLSMRDQMTDNMNTRSTNSSSPDIQSLRNAEVSGVNPSGEPVDINVMIQSRPRQ
jgi:hypothetical protein